jgi:predicted DNA-binding transcriptional regulator AlpA
MTICSTSSSTEDRKLLIGAADLGSLLGVGKSTIWSWHSSGRIPQPVRIGGTTRWREDEIRRWVDAGCPSRARWEELGGRETRFRG